MRDDDIPKENPVRPVASNAEADRARDWATSDVSRTLRALTANLLRAVRGAGKPHEIAEQAGEFVQAVVAYQKAFGHWPPSWEMSKMLSSGQPQEMLARLEGHEWSRAHAEQTIVRGALQVTASRLIGQSTQERAGENEMLDGVRSLEAAREEMHREFASRASVRDARPLRPRKPRS